MSPGITPDINALDSTCIDWPGYWNVARYQMDDQHVVIKTLRVAAITDQTTAVAGHQILPSATRLNALLQQHPVEVFFAPVSESTARVSTVPLVPDLPPNVHLQTFRTSLRSANPNY